MYGSISPGELCVRWNVPDALDDGGWMKPYVDAEALSGSEDLRRSARGPPTALYSGPSLVRRRWRRRRKERAPTMRPMASEPNATPMAPPVEMPLQANKNKGWIQRVREGTSQHKGGWTYEAAPELAVRHVVGPPPPEWRGPFVQV